MSHAIPLDQPVRMTREEFQRWACEQPTGRYERVNGVVIAMSPERANHARVKARAWSALTQGIRTAALSCEVFPDGMTVKVDDSDYEPDAILRCGPPLPGDAILVPDPLVVVEVLSPGTRRVDLTLKLAEYFRILTVQHYLIFRADQCQAIHHRRQGEAIETRVLGEGEIMLDPPGLRVALADIYDGLNLAPG